MPTLTELRAKLGSRADAFTDQELFEAASAAYGPMYSDPKILQKELGYDPEWDFGRGLRIGWQGVKAGVAGAGAAAADAVGWQGGRDAALNYGRQQQQQAFQLGRRSDDVDNFSQDPLSFLSSAAGQGLAFAAPSVLGGGLGALGARAVGLRALGGAAAGSYATNLGQETGGIYNDLAEQGKFEPGRALLYGAGAAALDTAAEAVPFLGKTTGGLARRMAGGVLKQSGVEAATETGQTAIERAGAYKPLDDAEAWHEYRNAAALGAVGGGMFGGAAGIPGPARTRQPVADPTPGAQTDLLATPAPALGWNGFHEVNQGQNPFVVFPDGSTVTEADAELMHRYGMTPDDLSGLRQGGPRVDPAMDTGDVSPYLPGKMVADEAGAVALDAPGADALYGREDGDPGLALARQRFMEQLQQNEQLRQKAEAVQAQGREMEARAQRAQQIVGGKVKVGSHIVDLVEALERQQEAGLIDDTTFAGEAYLLGQNQAGKVAKNIKTRDKAAQEQGNATDAGGTGQPGPADVGRGAGSQRAPGGPGSVQPAVSGAAAQAVSGAGAVQLGPRDPGGNTALSPVIGSKAADAPARAAKMVGRELSPAEQTVVKRLANATPRDQAIMRDLFGWDADGRQVSEPLTYDQISAKYTNDTGKNKGKPMTRQGVQAVLKKLGLTEEVADAIRMAYIAPVSSEELGIAQQDRAEGGVQEAKGFREGTAAEVMGEAKIDSPGRTIEDAKSFRDREARTAGINRFLAEADLSLDQLLEAAKVDAEIAARKAVTGTEFDAKRQAQADAQRAAPAPKRVKTVYDYLKRALDEGNIQPVDIEDAAAEYDQFVQNDPDGGIPWSELPASMQADWVGQYIKYQDQVSKDKRQAEQSYASAWMESQDEAEKRPRANRSGVLPGSAGAAPQESAAGRALPSNAAAAEAVQGADAADEDVSWGDAADEDVSWGDAADEDVSWGDEAAQMSRAGGRDENTTYHTADSLEDSLLSFMNADSLGRRVVIVETAADLKSTEDMLAGFDETAVAWARNGRAYLIADRIPVGQERGVFLHEVGGHLGLQRVLGQKEFDRLVSLIVGWSARKDNSQEATLARKARERVDQAGEEDPTQRQNELVAYFLEEAVNAGVNPTSLKYDTPLAQWMRTLWAAFKVALRKLGINPDKLTAQDVVDLGYGAARLTTTGRYHGTAAKVQQFRTKYIGTGEGAQAYGWGLYFSELKGVADEYKRADIKRKGRSSEYQYAGNPIYGDAQRNVVELATTDFAGQPDAIRRALAKHKADMAKMVADYEDLVSESRAAIVRATERKESVAQLMADMRDDLVNLQNARALLKDVQQLDAQKFTGGVAVPPKGATYATDIAIKDDEFLDWTELIEDQPARVREVIENNDALRRHAEDAEGAGFDNGTGGSLYRYLETVAEEGGIDDSSFSAEDKKRYMDGQMPGAEVVSKWLDSIGIKGVRMPVNYQRGGTYTEGRNFVVFNEKNVIKTLVNPENRVSKSIQFSKSVKPADAQALAAAQAAVTEALPAKAKDGWTNARDFFKKNAPYWLTNFQLAEQFGGKIKALKKYVHVADMMRMETVRQQMVFDEVSKRWDALPKAARKMLDQVALRATMQATHPDLPLDHKRNAHLDEDQKRGYAALAAQYKQMATAHPEAAKVYQDAKKALEDSRLRMEEASKQLFDAYGIKRTVPAETPGPYFPLMRFGEYLAIGESAEFKAVENELASAQGDARKELQKRLDKLKRDPKHYIVSAHETRSAMERAVADYQNRGLEARANMADQRLEALPKDVHKLVQDLAAKMADQFDPDTAHAVIDAYKDFLVKSLPELHALNRAAQRVGVEGASSDMLRAFAAGGRQNSFYTARLLHAKDSADTMLEMKREVKGNTDLQHVHRELEKRAALDLQFKDTPIQDMIGTLGWVYYLGVSPTFLFMNTTQPWLVTGPVLAGKYGLSKSTKALAQASREALAVLKDARWKDGKWSPWEGISEESVKTTRKNAEGVSEDRKALRALMQRGIVDEGLQHELRTFAEGGNRTLAKFGRWTGWASQQIELVNRTSTALATFRLARDQGMSYDEAVEEAYRVTTNTQIDYSAEGTARFMREGGGIPFAKLFFQFRRYQQTMLYVLGDNIKKLANPAERKVAAKSLAYFALTSGLAAGAMGLPFAGSIMLIANAFMDDDDEDGDAETRLRNLLFDLTGDRDAANVLAKGIPAMFNADLSQRIGLGQIAQLYPRLELNGRTGEENIGKVVANVAGPAAGLAAQFFQAGALFGNGDWMKGTEKLLPKYAADPIRAMRYATQGMTDSKGEQILGPDEISAWDKTLRALGTTAVSESNYYEGTKALRSVEQATNDRKTKIRMEYRRALRSGDFEDVRAMIDEFNEDHPGSPIKPKDELAWRKEAAKAGAQRGADGIKFNPKRDAKYGELMRFARE